MKRIYLIYCTCMLISSAVAQDKKYDRVLKLMGSRFDISAVAASPADGEKYLDLAVAEISRIEKLISSWDTNSETSEINRNAGIKPVKVSLELYDLIKRAIQISKITDGAFDISYASMDKVWKFDGTMTEMPTEGEIKNSIQKVGFENIILDDKNQTVFLKLEGMKIGFGAIGKGYAADKAKKLLQDLGVKAGLMNASGDLNCWGKQPDGSAWKVGITNPLNKNKIFSWFDIDDQAVVTSGNYEKYVEFNGKRYTHIIDPRTGYPATGIVSVSVFAPKAELADALATSIFVMGTSVGLNFINQLNGVECIIIDDQNKMHYSKNIQPKIISKS
jgi:thiamine biosynthesis lipoprotein